MMGYSMWSFYGAFGLGLILAIITTVILNWWSGVGGSSFHIPKQRDDFKVEIHKGFDDDWIRGGRNLW